MQAEILAPAPPRRPKEGTTLAPRKTHRLNLNTNRNPKGPLAHLLGLSGEDEDVRKVTALGERAAREGWTLLRILEEAQALEITDDLWANFLFTLGYRDGRQTF
jgi:hypothetical protein